MHTNKTLAHLSPLHDQFGHVALTSAHEGWSGGRRIRGGIMKPPAAPIWKELPVPRPCMRGGWPAR